MKKKRTMTAYIGTVLSVLFFITLTVDPFRQWIFQFLSKREVNDSNVFSGTSNYMITNKLV
ncbi:hypothetical protein [Guptibacillus spartinae]|uniref:hypothetical protein n=1 Tax=Guptibacillus spartinae TaxID=3025679 RepID=UPI00235E3D8C|nr:hypothetical protein [Pseudalkalibacillus spartinae]